MKILSRFAILMASAAATGCGFQNTTSLLMPTAPSAVAGLPAASSGSSAASSSSSSNSSSGSSGSTDSASSGFSGTWASPNIAGLPSLSSCSDLQWSISSQSATSVAGSVSAVCGGVATISANLTGQLSGTEIVNLTAKGTAVAFGITCGFDLTGVGNRLTSDSVKLDYQGTTCLGPVSGSEVLRRASPTPAPAPPAAPQPAPEPQPDPNDVLFGCGDLPAGVDLVGCIHIHIRPRNERSAFEVTKRVAWALRYKGGGGLLLKPTGENIVTWRGYTFAAGRIMYPDGHIYKVLTDVGPGGANGPSWQDEGFVDRGRYLPALDPALP